MATLAEEIQMRIDIYGGREVLIREIEKEWPLNPVRKWIRFKKPISVGDNRLGAWTQQQIDFMAENLQKLGSRAIGKIIGKTDRAVYSKACRMGFRTWYDPDVNFYTKAIRKKADQ
jgi:hypothetical protein